MNLFNTKFFSQFQKKKQSKSTPMKTLNCTFRLLFLVTFSSLQGNSQEYKLAPNIDDLEISPASLDIYIARQNNLLDQIDDGVIIINSNSLGYTGGRHELKLTIIFTISQE